MTDTAAEATAESARSSPVGILTVGLVMGLVNALLTVALMSLVFVGDLAEFLPLALRVGLLASAAISLVVGFSSSFPGSYAGVQDAPAAVLSVAAAAAVATVAADREVATVFALMATTSLATGILFLVMGRFHLGQIARYVPFPVVGGLIAGTGYLIVVGSVEILGGLGGAEDLFTSTAVGTLWAGTLVAVGLYLLARLDWPSWSYLALLVVVFLVFQVIDLAAAPGDEWFLGPFPDGGGRFTAIGFLGDADWGAVLGQIGTLASVLVIAPLSLLLYVSALELEANADLDLDRELKSTGLANLAAAVIGGPPGYMYLADTLIAHRLFGRSRGPVLVSAAGLLALSLSGPGLLELLPTALIGGLLMFIGFEFLHDWLWESRRRMSRIDYILMVAIALTIAIIGFLPGVLAGLMAAVGLFVYRYSRVDVIKHTYTAAQQSSNIERAAAATSFLQEAGSSVIVAELQGFVFFGTANQILDLVNRRIRSSEPSEFFVFDFQGVTGVDSSAIAVFERIAVLCAEHGIRLLLSGLRNEIADQFSEVIEGLPDTVRTEPDLDYALASCEERLLAGQAASNVGDVPLPPDLMKRLDPHLEMVEFLPGDRLMTQGDHSPGLLMLLDGKASVILEYLESEPVRVRTLLGGTVLGEISLYTGSPCTATVVADAPCLVARLSPVRFEGLPAEDPATAERLNAYVAKILAERVAQANETIRALRRH